MLVLQAPVIGLLIAIVFHSGALAAGASPIGAVELVFLVMTGAIWLGVASAVREVVKERGLVEREFDVGIRLDAYVLAKAAGPVRAELRPGPAAGAGGRGSEAARDR